MNFDKRVLYAQILFGVMIIITQNIGQYNTVLGMLVVGAALYILYVGKEEVLTELTNKEAWTRAYDMNKDLVRMPSLVELKEQDNQIEIPATGYKTFQYKYRVQGLMRYVVKIKDVKKGEDILAICWNPNEEERAPGEYRKAEHDALAGEDPIIALKKLKAKSGAKSFRDLANIVNLKDEEMVR